MQNLTGYKRKIIYEIFITVNLKDFWNTEFLKNDFRHYRKCIFIFVVWNLICVYQCFCQQISIQKEYRQIKNGLPEIYD